MKAIPKFLNKKWVSDESPHFITLEISTEHFNLPMYAINKHAFNEEIFLQLQQQRIIVSFMPDNTLRINEQDKDAVEKVITAVYKRAYNMVPILFQLND
jgi:hypothetical protein